MSNGLWGLVNNSNYYVWKRVYTNLIDLIRDVFQLVYVLRDRVHESICSHRIKMVNITPDRFSPSGCVVFMLVNIRMSKTERKSQNFAHDTWALGLVKPILLPKFLVDYLSQHPILLSYMQTTTKKIVSVFDGFAKRW